MTAGWSPLKVFGFLTRHSQNETGPADDPGVVVELLTELFQHREYAGWVETSAT
jgi:hypothetical protein